MDHLLRDCRMVNASIKDLSKDDYPFSLALTSELNLIEKVSRNWVSPEKS